MHDLAVLTDRLARHRPRRLPLRRRLKRAAVAVVLRDSAQGVETLLVERATRRGDPWSGDMALPGGRVDAADEASASTAACRETAEEVGLILSRADGIGRLGDRLTLDHRRRAPMVVSPFVYRLDTGAELTLNHEIASAQWVALGWLAEPAHRHRMQWRVGPLKLSLPCYDWDDGRRLWGLTLLIVDELLALAR